MVLQQGRQWTPVVRPIGVSFFTPPADTLHNHFPESIENNVEGFETGECLKNFTFGRSRTPRRHGMLGYRRVAEMYPFELPRMLREAGYFAGVIMKCP